MPVLALALYPTFYIARLMRSSMLDVMGQDYMRTARAKGVSTAKMIFKHALRNAILPVVTYLGPLLASLLTGSFIIEYSGTRLGICRSNHKPRLPDDYGNNDFSCGLRDFYERSC